MYLLDEKKLRKGDIILLRFETDKSKLIRKFSKSEYSHAMIYVGGSSIIDSDGPGVHAHNLQRLLIPKENDVVVLRSKNASSDHLWLVEQFVRSKVGTEYSMEEARKVVRNGDFVPEDNRQFCTRLVAKAYEYSGISIVERADYCSPKDIEDSSELIVVQGVTRVANTKEIDYANETDTPLQKQEDITNEILENIRNSISEDIQTFEQIDEFLIKYPEHDTEITRIISQSGYFKLWEMDLEKNPWYYDYEAFKNHFPETHYAIAGTRIIDFCKELFNRYAIMKAHYHEKSSQYKIEYFQKMNKLYTKLLELNQKRMEVAIDAMIDAGLSQEEITALGKP